MWLNFTNVKVFALRLRPITYANNYLYAHLSLLPYPVATLYSAPSKRIMQVSQCTFNTYHAGLADII
jgi:hypothetical protein